MAVFIVGRSGLTFEAAVKAAEAEPGADTIRFADDVSRVELDEALTISGELVIDGDHDNDGISDVVISAGDNRHFNIGATAVVTIKNVDLIGGYDAPRTYDTLSRPAAAQGKAGNEGTLTKSGYRLDGADGNDDAGNGFRGADGEDGLDAVGSILNAGDLTLVRVGFGNNYAQAEIGQQGGTGGPGGSSRAENGATDNVSGLESTGFGLPEEYRQYLLSDALEGGEGGDGGRGGNGARGGDGGDGGDAAGAIYNTGSLTLVDTVFAGRLTSGTIVGGNNAYGGFPGAGGGGGYGGSSFAGDGGASGRQFFAENTKGYGYVWDSNYEENGKSPNVKLVGPGEPSLLGIGIYTEETAPAGKGGDGGIPGNGGSGGRGGNSGDAATILNFGSVEGKAALANNPDGDTFHNIADVDDAGRAGFAGAGGGSYGGEGGTELGPFKSIQYSRELDLGNYARNGTEVPRHIEDIWSDFESRTGYGYGDLPLAGGGPEYTFEGYADDGVSLGRGTNGSLGKPGLKGKATTGVGGEGTAAVTTNNLLVYAHDLDTDASDGKLSFNIIRVGDVSEGVDVDWRLVGNGKDPISAADFAPGTKLSGTVKFKALGAGDDVSAEADEGNNVRHVVLDLLADGIPEPPEGYRFELTDASGAAVLGTSVLVGTAIDSKADDKPGGTPGDDEPILGNGGPNDLKGTPRDDVFRAGGGDDTVSPGLGKDEITLGRGEDTVKGTLAELFGDTVTDFSGDDALTIVGRTVERSLINVLPGSAILAIDQDGDGRANGRIYLEGDFSGGDFMAVAKGGDTAITFETFLPTLSDGAAVARSAVNGINNQAFLTGDGVKGFEIALVDTGYASYDNVLGSYEIDERGNIVDVRFLFESVNADRTAEAFIRGVENGHTVGFFIVQDGADWAETVDLFDKLSFVNGAGEAANLSDGSDIFLAVNGKATDEVVFHSFSRSLNVDGKQHALSGVEEGGEAITIGFEDLTGTGDRDYEDVVFRVTPDDLVV